nr:uncharacterized protein K02A2.6-like [Nerophis lumbriciformis]
MDCRSCGRRGHTEQACLRIKNKEQTSKSANIHDSVKNRRKTQVNTVRQRETVSSDSSEGEQEMSVHTLNIMKMDEDSEGYWVEPMLEGHPVSMQIDTGSKASIISDGVYKKVLRHLPLRPSDTRFKTYRGEPVPMAGMTDVVVQSNNQVRKIPIYIVKGDYPAILGRVWLEKMKLSWHTVKMVSPTATSLAAILRKHDEVFRKELGSMKDITVKLNIKPETTPKFMKARSVPYAIRSKVGDELDALVKSGALEPVTVSEWATPIVPVPKETGEIRICGDFKVTLNPVLSAEQYPLPRIDDLFAGLSKGQKFSKIDLNQAYLQMHVHEDSKDLLTITTQKGLFRYCRLPFGITSAPALFHCAMDQILHGLPGVQCYLDDILCTGSTDQEHLDNLDAALQRLKEYGLRLACDASPYGVGAVISHLMPDGVERPIEFASRTLNKAETNYAQIEREALSIVYGVCKFHQYLYGRQFTLLTDHRPLTTILGLHTGLPSLAASRMQRWALLLSAHSYDIKYRKADLHSNADSLSRLPLPITWPEPRAAEIFYFSQVDGSDAPSIQPYLSRRAELWVQSGCLLWGRRVVIPPSLRKSVLQQLHAGHSGIVRMKEIARSYFWWPGVDREIETTAKTCSSCQEVRKAPQLAPLHPWEFPEEPWQRVHYDFAGPVEGCMLLVCVDAHSKWPEVAIMKTTTTAKTIERLGEIFSRFGSPLQLVSDNGPQLVSQEMTTFLEAKGIQHIRSAPFHPATNGLAERFVQTMKKALKTSQEQGSFLQRLHRFLLSYRNNPHATTKVPPLL